MAGATSEVTLGRALIASVVLAALLAEPGLATATLPDTPERLVLSITDTETWQSDLFSIQSDGTGLEQLTDDAARETKPAVSPRGRHVAYVVAGEDRSVIKVLDLRNGSNFRVFEYPPPGSISGISWAPNSKWLAVGVEAKAGLGDVMLVPIAGGEPQHVRSVNTGGTGPSVDWSPSGDLLAIMLDPLGDGPMIATVTLDGSDLTVLAEGTSPSWSPDGAEIVFVGNGGTSIIEADGSNLRVIPGLELGEPPGPQLGVGFYPVWSPSGGEVAVIGFGGLDARAVDAVTGATRVLYSNAPNTVDSLDWGPATGGGAFADVPDANVFFDDIEWLYAATITSGCNPPLNDLFCVGDPATRGQVAAFLGRAFDLSAEDGSDRFNDDDGSVFEREIEALAAHGITMGCNPPANDMFCPDRWTTRGEIAAFFSRALAIQPSGTDWFLDDETSIFERNINAIADVGITRGCTPAGDRFCPTSVVRRGQIAAFLHRSAALGP